MINYLPEIILRTLSFTSVGSGGNIPDVIATSGAGDEPFTIGETVGATIGIVAGAGFFYLIHARCYRPNLKRFRRE